GQRLRRSWRRPFLVVKAHLLVAMLEVRLWLLPADRELHSGDVPVRREQGARLSRRCRRGGVWLAPQAGEVRARELLELVLMFRPGSHLHCPKPRPLETFRSQQTSCLR